MKLILLIFTLVIIYEVKRVKGVKSVCESLRNNGSILKDIVMILKRYHIVGINIA